MTKRPFISNAVPSITQTQLEDHHMDDFVFARWHTRHVLNWLRGNAVAQLFANSLGGFRNRRVSLHVFTSIHTKSTQWQFFEWTDRRAVEKIGHYKRSGTTLDSTSQSTVTLLRKYLNYLTLQFFRFKAYDIKTENAQKLALKVSVSVQNLNNAIALATPIINSPTQSSRSLVVLNSVLMSVSEIHENVTKLIFCLDRQAKLTKSTHSNLI